MKKNWSILLWFLIISNIGNTHSMSRLFRRSSVTKTTQAKKTPIKKSWLISAEQYFANKQRTSALKTSSVGSSWWPSFLTWSRPKTIAPTEKPLSLSFATKAKTWGKTGASFKEQEQRMDQINISKLNAAINNIRKNNWYFDDRPHENWAKVKNFKKYINAEGIEVIAHALEDFVQPQEVKKIIDDAKMLNLPDPEKAQIIADKLYALFFPTPGDEYSKRFALNQKRRGIIEHLDKLIEIGARLNDPEGKKLQSILETLHTIIHFLKTSKNPLHKLDSDPKHAAGAPVGETFTRLMPSLIKIAKKEGLTSEKLNFNIIDLRARTEALKIVNSFYVSPKPRDE